MDNKNLYTQLVDKKGWIEEKYWRVRNRLIEQGELGSERGRGGSVRRLH